MKRFFALMIAGCSLTTIAGAQSYEDVSPSRSGKLNNIRIGVFIAPNISWMKPTANKSDDRMYLVSSEGSKMGYSWGLMIDKPFAENYGFSTGLHITTSGGKILAQENRSVSQPATRVTYADFDYRLQFLEIPFNLKLRSDELGSGIHVFGQAGLSLGLNISKKASYEVRYIDTVGTPEKTVSETNEKLFGGLSIPPLMLSLNIGGGVEYAISNKMAIYAGLFFNNGFAPDATNPNRLDMNYSGSFSDGNTRLNNIALRLGIFF
jgi:hypothetical protein